MTNLDELIHYTFICILYDVLHVISTFSSRIKKHLCNNFTQIVSILLFVQVWAEILNLFFPAWTKIQSPLLSHIFSGGMIYTILSLHYLRMLYKSFGCFYPHGLWKIFYRFSFYLFFSFLVKFQKRISPVFNFIKLNPPSFKDA